MSLHPQLYHSPMPTCRKLAMPKQLGGGPVYGVRLGGGGRGQHGVQLAEHAACGPRTSASG